MRSAEIRKIIAGIQEIPTLPAVATRILELTSEDSPSATALTSVIQSDQAMAAKILKLANSPFYGSRGNVTTLQRAISVLGLRMVRNAALSLSVFDLFKKEDTGNGRKLFYVTDFWRHCAAVAIASELLARRCGYPAPEEAFVAGLIHDIGKVVFYTNAPEEFNMVLEDVRQSRRTLLDAEEDLIGIGHTQVGRLLTEKWGLPQVLIEAVWLHHQPIRIESKGIPKLSSIIRLADSLCLCNHIGASGNTCSSVFHNPIFASMNMDERTADQIAKDVLVRLEDMGDLFGLETCSVDMYLSAVRRANAELGRLNLELEQHNRELNVRRKALDATKGLFKEITPHILPNEAVRLICTASLATLDCRRTMCFYLDDPDEQVYGVVLSKDQEEREIAWPIKGGVLAPVSSELSSEAVNLIEASLLGATDGYQVGDEVLRTIQTSTLMATPLVAHGKVLGQLIVDLENCNTPVPLAKLALENLAVVSASTLERAIMFERSSSQTETLARMNRQIEEAQQQLLHSERLASIGTLAAGAAHEINNPLAVISAKAQIMQRKTEDPEQQDGYRIIIEQTKRIAKIIGDLMGFARPADPKMEQVIIQAVVERSLSLVENRIALADIEVSINFPENLPLVMGDSNQLDQVFLNLFVNAQQAMSKGGEIRIEGRQSEDGKHIMVCFTDTGRGIPQKNLQRIFDPFFTTKKQGEGTGLGLAVSHRIIEAHGGRMTVDSKLGEGTTFTILLPVSQSAQIKEIQSELLKNTMRSPLKGRDKQKILIIDDEDLIRETLELSLDEEGYTVECARDGLEGLQKILDGAFDLVLLDIRMPHRDGMDVLEGIKENLRKLPVIIITGLAAEKEIQECLEAGAFECIRKPFEVSEVLSSVRRALKEFRKKQTTAGQSA